MFQHYEIEGNIDINLRNFWYKQYSERWKQIERKDFQI